MESENTNYDRLVKMLDEIEIGEEETRSVVIKPKEAFATQMQISIYDYNKAVREIGFSESTRGYEQRQPAPEGAAIPKIQVENNLARERSDAANEIKHLIGGAGREFEDVIGREVATLPKEKLILPTLSLQDQIHELEGIKKAMQTNALNENQIDVVKLEIAGLNEQMKSEKLTLDDEFQRSLFELRNKLLGEIKNRLLNVNN